MTDCQRCGDTLTDADKDNRGWYRDHCRDCLAQLSDAQDGENRPPAQWIRETPAPEGWDE